MALRGLRGPRGGRRVPLVITWHTKAQIEGARAGLVHLMERRVARAASVVLGACSDLVDRARDRGARDARLAPVAIPRPRSGGAPASPRAMTGCATRSGPNWARWTARAARGRPSRPGPGARPAAGRGARLARPRPAAAGRHRGGGAGAGRATAADRRRAAARSSCSAAATTYRELLAAADLVVLSSSWEARSLIAQEALRAGVPLVATDAGAPANWSAGPPNSSRYGDAAALARTVRLLADPARRDELAAAGRAQAAAGRARTTPSPMSSASTTNWCRPFCA